MKLLEGKTAIVTGAARGIGEGIALKFAEEGANVAFTYVSDSSGERAKALTVGQRGVRRTGNRSIGQNLDPPWPSRRGPRCASED